MGRLILFLLLVVVAPADAMTKKQALCVELELYYSYENKTKYVWGGTDLARGADCSGSLFRACRRCGVPVLRTTSYRMLSENASGWEGAEIGIEDAYPGATLTGFTLKSSRPLGHIGMAVDYYRQNQIKFFHMSSSRKRATISVIRTQPPNWWYQQPKVFKLLLTPEQEPKTLYRKVSSWISK